MDIQKIVIHKDSAITIGYSIIREAPEGDDPVYEKVTFKSNRDAQQGFYAALGALRPYAINMLEIEESELTRIAVKGVTFKRTAKGIQGISILVERSMDHAITPVRMETPHYIGESYSEDGDEENILDPECVDVLKLLRTAANDYVNGVTDQAELPLEE